MNEPHLERLRALTRSGDLEAAAALYTEANRRGLTLDCQLAGRTLFAAGRGRVDTAAQLRELRDRHGDPPYRLSSAWASDHFVAVIEGHEGYRSGYVVAQLVVETLRECLEPGHRFDPEAVYAEHDAHWRPLTRVAEAIECPALPDAPEARLLTALLLAERRMQAWDDHHPEWQTTYGAQVDVAVFDLPRVLVAHIGLGATLHWHDGELTTLTPRHDIASRWQGSGLMTPGEQYDWTLMPDRMLSSVSPRDDDEGHHTRRQIHWQTVELAYGDRLVLVNDPRRLELTEASLTTLVASAPPRAEALCAQVLDHAAQRSRPGRQAAIAVARATL